MRIFHSIAGLLLLTLTAKCSSEVELELFEAHGSGFRVMQLDFFRGYEAGEKCVGIPLINGILSYLNTTNCSSEQRYEIAHALFQGSVLPVLTYRDRTPYKRNGLLPGIPRIPYGAYLIPFVLQTIEEHYFDLLDASKKQAVTDTFEIIARNYFNHTFVCQPAEIPKCNGIYAYTKPNLSNSTINLCPWFFDRAGNLMDVFKDQKYYNIQPKAKNKGTVLLHEMVHLAYAMTPMEGMNPIAYMKDQRCTRGCPEVNSTCGCYGRKLSQVLANLNPPAAFTNVDNYVYYAYDLVAEKILNTATWTWYIYDEPTQDRIDATYDHDEL